MDFILPDNPDITDLLVYADWLEENDKASIRPFINKVCPMTDVKGKYGNKREFIWFNSEDFCNNTPEEKLHELPFYIWGNLKGNTEKWQVYWFKTYKTEVAAWIALQNALELARPSQRSIVNESIPHS